MNIAEQVDLLPQATAYWDLFTELLSIHGVALSPALSLQRSPNVWTYYDLADTTVYLAVPNPAQPEGKLHQVMLRSLLSMATDADFYDLCRLLIPHAMGHELAHHLRHITGNFGPNHWHEEQIANQLATVLLRATIPLQELRSIQPLLEQAIAGLATTATDDPLFGYHDIGHLGHCLGLLTTEECMEYQLLQHLFGVAPARLKWELGPTVETRCSEWISCFNNTYAADYRHYLYCQLRWLELDLTNPRPLSLSQVIEDYTLH